MGYVELMRCKTTKRNESLYDEMMRRKNLRRCDDALNSQKSGNKINNV